MRNKLALVTIVALLAVPLYAQTIRPTRVSQLRLTQLTTAQEAGMTLVEGDIWENITIGCIRYRLASSTVCLAEAGGAPSGAVLLNPAGSQAILDFNLSTPILNNIRVVDGNKFTTIQLALDDSGAVVVMVPDTYAGAEETSIGVGQIVIDFRNGGVETRSNPPGTAAETEIEVAGNAGDSQAEYGASQAGSSFSGMISAVNIVPNGATVAAANAVSGFVRAEDAGTNAVGGYFQARAAVDNANIFGGNSLIQFPASGPGSSGAGGIAHEFNVNILSASTVNGIGISVVGESTAQPSGAAQALKVDELGLSNDIKWKEGLVFVDGSVDVAIQLNTINTGNNQGSQNIRFRSRDSGGTERNAELIADANGALSMVGNGNIGFSVEPDGKGRLAVGFNSDGGGLKHARVASCTTAASTNANCDTTITWTTAFADANYTAVCTTDNPSVAVGVFVVGTNTKLAASVKVTIQNTPGNSSATSATINCFVPHD